jgi:DNA mismatch endonuclease (patch repair protein)
MRSVKAKNTKPEMIVRRLAHGLGYRYRLHQAGLPGKPDLVFGSRRAVIFVHGCFWHSHDGCARATKPSANAKFWQDKLSRNTARDARHLAALAEIGWRTLVIWECETKDRQSLSARLQEFLC